MSAFFIANVKIKNIDKFQEYGQQASSTLTQYGGEIVIKGKFDGVLAGNSADHDMVAILKFPDMNSLNKWYKSDEYQSLIPLRDQGADVSFIKYNEPPMAA